MDKKPANIGIFVPEALNDTRLLLALYLTFLSALAALSSRNRHILWFYPAALNRLFSGNSHNHLPDCLIEQATTDAAAVRKQTIKQPARAVRHCRSTP